jgi:hypothetical protein
MKSFQVGNRVVWVSSSNGRFVVTVDEVPLSRWFLTLADAWTAGVREVDRLDHVASVRVEHAR